MGCLLLSTSTDGRARGRATETAYTCERDSEGGVECATIPSRMQSTPFGTGCFEFFYSL